jgi:hypothetical protein
LANASENLRDATELVLVGSDNRRQRYLSLMVGVAAKTVKAIC